MSANIIPYRVLWVDDDPTIVDGMKANADEYGLDLHHFYNWSDAKKDLLDNFAEYTAIILDAYCKNDAGEKEDETFITTVLPELTNIFGEKKRPIAWYILSAGTMSSFEFVIKSAERSRSEFAENWGAMLYLKDVPDENAKSSRALFENIKTFAPTAHYNIILSHHSETFRYIGEGKLIDKRARKKLLQMLDALYFPEDNQKFEFAGNPLRKIIEYLFRAAKKVGLLPDECFDGDEIKLQLASLFFAGKGISYDRGHKEKMVRWGNQGTQKDGSDADQIFPQSISDILKYVLNQYVNPDSHTSENEPFLVDEQNKELFFGCVLQICHVIKWFGAYVERNHDAAKNKAMHRYYEVALDKGKPTTKKEQKKSEEKLAEMTKREDANPAPKPISAEELVGKSGRVLNGKKGLYVHADAKCKVVAELKPQLTIGKSVIIEAVESNTGKDAEEYPFIITKLTIN